MQHAQECSYSKDIRQSGGAGQLFTYLCGSKCLHLIVNRQILLPQTFAGAMLACNNYYCSDLVPASIVVYHNNFSSSQLNFIATL